MRFRTTSLRACPGRRAVQAGLLAGAALAGPAMAQSCQAPLAVPTGTVQPFDTCQSANHLPNFGPIPSPHRDIVHVLRVSSGLPGSLRIRAQPGASSLVALVLTGTCDSSTLPVATWDLSSGPAQIPVTGWSARSVYVVVTTDPGVPASVCGAYEIDVEGLFFDPIFRSRFE